MANPEQPQLYLITPPEIELSSFPGILAKVLDTSPVACIRLALSSPDEDLIARAADACREVAHARDIAIVIEDHILLAERLGLDGVHLTDGVRLVRKARETLGKDAIIGAFCGASRHDGLNAGEAGADYVSFGPVGLTALGDGNQAPPDLFAWWSEMIEVPVVAEGALDVDNIKQLAAVTDFFAIGSEIWHHDDPASELTRLSAAMS
ncbi:MAG: thiamine phosphate synthase [Rhodobacteraceae bacterium]|nr:thiamine phosphate synthase [Paracoccaceae bacterium]